MTSTPSIKEKATSLLRHYENADWIVSVGSKGEDELVIYAHSKPNVTIPDTWEGMKVLVKVIRSVNPAGDAEQNHRLHRAKRIRQAFAALSRYISRTPELLSLLYDLNLLPEQLSEGTPDYRRMVILAHWHHERAKKKSPRLGSPTAETQR